MLDHWLGVLTVDGGIGEKHAFDPRAWGRAGEAAMAERVRQACEQLRSAGRSLAGSASASDRAARSLIDLDWVAGSGRDEPGFTADPTFGGHTVRITAAVIGLAYHPVGQPCCRTGERHASLGVQR